jgi:predicted Zn finger-like uncharacterized protein
MKITCQACQSKYTIADDKIQGKVAKIRCRKCGATVLVDASGSSAQSNGSMPPPAGGAESWLVSVGEGDQRTMQLAELVDAYNTGVVTGETYIWKDGMTDWVPLADAPEVVAALNNANEAPAAAPVPAPAPEPVRAPAAEPRAPVAFSPPAAARRETTRGRSGDLFGGGAAEEEVATSASPVVARATGAASGGGLGGGSGLGAAASGTSATGARDEQSVLFSLTALTSNTKPAAPAVASAPSATSSRTEDSGLIDLNALAKAQAARPVEAAPPAAPIGTPFLFPAALGSVEIPEPTEAKKKSSMPLIIGGGVAIAGLAIALALVATKKSDEPAPAPVASVTAAPTPEPVATAAPTATETAATASAAPDKAPAKRPGGGGGAKAAGPKAGAAAQPTTALPPPPVKKASPCGCAAGDLQCQIRCSATGH